MANDFQQFCPIDTGTNLEDLGDYAVDADRISGNKPGVAKSALNNRALRQANFITSQMGQLISDRLGVDALDDADTARILSQLNALITDRVPVQTLYTSGSGTHNVTYKFFIASGNATVGATYTNNSITFTVVSTVAASVRVNMTGSGAPLTSGTLTKTGGTGDATLTFYAVRSPLYLRVAMVGAGAGGQGGGTSAGTTATAGGDTTFGTGGGQSIAGGGAIGTFASFGGVGGSATLGSGATGIAVGGGDGGGGQGVVATSLGLSGGQGGSSIYGGAGASGPGGGTANAAHANSGSGGGGGGANNVSSGGSGSGGGSGGGIDAFITTPLSTYAYVVGAGGTAGGAGGSGRAGGAGAAGRIMVMEYYQ
jgi:hypothetical protein